MEGDWNIYWSEKRAECTECNVKYIFIVVLSFNNRASVNTIRQMFNPETGYRLTDMQ